MNKNESIQNGYLAANGFTRVYANATQAAKAAARLRGAGFNASPMQSFQSMRFLVKIA
jgi:hypothetical protein